MTAEHAFPTGGDEASGTQLPDGEELLSLDSLPSAYPSDETEAARVERLFDETSIDKIMTSDKVSPREKALLAIKYGIDHPALRQLKVKVRGAEVGYDEILGNLPSPVPDRDLTKQELGTAFGISDTRIGQVREMAARKALAVIIGQPFHKNTRM